MLSFLLEYNLFIVLSSFAFLINGILKELSDKQKWICKFENELQLRNLRKNVKIQKLHENQII